MGASGQTVHDRGRTTRRWARPLCGDVSYEAVPYGHVPCCRQTTIR